MATQWFAAQAFETDQRLLKAINTLAYSLQLKQLHRKPDESLAEQSEAAGAELREALSQLGKVEESAERHRVPVGVGLYFRDLAGSLLDAKQDDRFPSPLVKEGAGAFVHRFSEVLAACTPTDEQLAAVLAGLDDLRSLIRRSDRMRSQSAAKGL